MWRRGILDEEERVLEAGNSYSSLTVPNIYLIIKSWLASNFPSPAYMELEVELQYINVTLKGAPSTTIVLIIFFDIPSVFFRTELTHTHPA
ncbi:uncharacterized protein ARMOST_17989 [Armillaria ostoyae]|uniref:Uncharacterized protein n=1 Tax=Armillaria ostoyae TaxID=47428 RepID=A0A284S0R0_ARMOS|nr:uncharacterized protein ARMOST_17989 [Armillaria ostoyae]